MNRRSWQAKTGLLMALPTMIGLVVFMFGPMIASLVISLTDWQIGASPSFVGLDNYTELFSADPLFWKSLWVTLYYTLLTVPLLLVVAFGVALLLNARVRGKGLFRTIYYLPALVPIVANAVLWNWMFNPDFGLFNEILRSVGMSTSNWTFDERTVIPSLVLMTVWGFGNIMVIFLAGLQDVPEYLYEAISLDGGNWWHAFRNITLPLMTPIIFYNLVTSLVATIQTFDQAYIMTNGGPNNGSLFIVYYLYRSAFTNSMMGYASALAWVVFVLIGIFTLLLFRWSRSWVHYGIGGAR
ncbi:carbohydrate ABC transporter permease [Brachybacterium subflavum]|uniref:carbohydrate ABC transporter permease n=1 Tax=Brachybacterium subflavum TaxID=2585206 RepID=UPI001266293C|nr:sugar ABC transporter permease [Brachybacterium subflavum]